MSDLEKLLAAIEKRSVVNGHQDIVLCTFLKEVVRDALGHAPEPAAPQPSLFVAPGAAPEFPQFRVKYDGEEIARRRVNSLDDLGRLIREDYSWASAMPIPVKE